MKIEIDKHVNSNSILVGINGRVLDVPIEDIKALRKALKKYQPKEDTKFKVGDHVISDFFGTGIVMLKRRNKAYSVRVLFENGLTEDFTPKGKHPDICINARRHIKKVKQ